MRSLHTGAMRRPLPLADAFVTEASGPYSSSRRCICWNISQPGSIGSQ